MNYVLIVKSNHLTTGRQALQTAQDLLKQQHKISCIYFLFDGVYVANKYIDMPSDEFNLTKAWQDLSIANDLSLLVCAASGFRRGIVAETIADRFIFGSIGQLVDGCDQAKQVLTL
jgi:tRNA 2-thiouridine synthesizing protein D